MLAGVVCFAPLSLGWTMRNYGSDVAFAHPRLHLVACTPGGVVLLHDVSECKAREVVLEAPVTVSRGYASVPSGPRPGARLDRRALEGCFRGPVGFGCVLGCRPAVARGRGKR